MTQEILNLTLAEFWEKYSNGKEIVIPTMDFFAEQSESVYRDMFYYSELKHMYLSKTGDIFRIYNPYGQDYECSSGDSISDLLVGVYKIIYKHYKTFIEGVISTIYYTYDNVLVESQYPNEYNYFKYRPKNIMGVYSIEYHFDDRGCMHITDIKEKAKV